jgi:hypothetical protein
LEHRNWVLEQAAEWKDVSKRKTVQLTGANAVPVLPRSMVPRSSISMEFSNFKMAHNDSLRPGFKPCNSSVNDPFRKEIKKELFPVAGILGPIPHSFRVSSYLGPLIELCPNCLASAHSQSGCSRVT